MRVGLRAVRQPFSSLGRKVARIAKIAPLKLAAWWVCAIINQRGWRELFWKTSNADLFCNGVLEIWQNAWVNDEAKIWLSSVSSSLAILIRSAHGEFVVYLLECAVWAKYCAVRTNRIDRNTCVFSRIVVWAPVLCVAWKVDNVRNNSFNYRWVPLHFLAGISYELFDTFVELAWMANWYMARFGGRIYIWFVWFVGWGIRMALELTYQNISGAEVNFYMLLCLARWNKEEQTWAQQSRVFLSCSFQETINWRSKSGEMFSWFKNWNMSNKLVCCSCWLYQYR